MTTQTPAPSAHELAKAHAMKRHSGLNTEEIKVTGSYCGYVAGFQEATEINKEEIERLIAHLKEKDSEFIARGQLINVLKHCLSGSEEERKELESNFEAMRSDRDVLDEANIQLNHKMIAIESENQKLMVQLKEKHICEDCESIQYHFEEENKKLREAVLFYANRTNWHNPSNSGHSVEDAITYIDIQKDHDEHTGETYGCGGKRAREAIKAADEVLAK